jgi:hypothetical protein
MLLGSAKIEIGLIQRRHDHGGREVLQHGTHRVRRLPIVGEGTLKESGLGTEADRLGDGHAGVNAEAACRVRGRLNHPPLIPAPAHHQQLDVAQLGVIVAGYLDEEGIEVHVEEARRHAG